jgi:pantothenate kinase-related protein Tda10
MIGLLFQFASEPVEVRIMQHNVVFRKTGSGYATIDNLRLDKLGVIKEFPDLKDSENWREEAVRRFKDKIKEMKSEEEISKYIINDLTKFGYKAIAKQREGFRVEKL